MEKGYIRHKTATVSRIITAGETIDADDREVTSISFKNIGTVDATVNGIPLNVGDPMRSYNNELPHLDTTQYIVLFSPIAGSKQVAVEYKKITGSTFVEVKNVSKCK